MNTKTKINNQSTLSINWSVFFMLLFFVCSIFNPKIVNADDTQCCVKTTDSSNSSYGKAENCTDTTTGCDKSVYPAGGVTGTCASQPNYYKVCNSCTGNGGNCKDSCTSTEEDWNQMDCTTAHCCYNSGGTGTATNTSSNNTSSNTSSSSSYKYTPMENIPGFESTATDLASYIVTIYKFGLWTIGICALLMITIGGIMYITSAGNTGSMGKAKGIITDAIIGVVMAFTSYLLLYTINPDLAKITLWNSTASNSSSSSSSSSGSGGSSSGNGTTDKAAGTCTTVTNTASPCYVDNLKTTCIGSTYAERASKICNKESGGNETAASGQDYCRPGSSPSTTVSWGLFQINISANNLSGSDCTQTTCASSAATPMYTASNHNCTLQSNYNACRDSAKIAKCNIETACNMGLSSGNLGPWANECN